MNNHWPTIAAKSQLSALLLAAATLPFSITLCHWGFGIYILLWTTEGNWKDKFNVLKRSFILQVVLAFTLLLVLGMIYTENKTEGWLSLEKKIFFFAMPVALATSKIRYTKSEVRLILYFFTVACFVGTLICLLHAVRQAESGLTPEVLALQLNAPEFQTLNPSASYQWLIFSYLGLASGLNMHPGYLSMYLAFCILFTIRELAYENMRSGYKALAIVAVLHFSVFTICLASRIILVNLFILCFSITVIFFTQHAYRRMAYSLTALLLAALIILYVNPISRYKNLQEIFHSSFTIREKAVYTTSTEIRASLLWVAWKSFTSMNLWKGVGTGDVNDSMKATSAEYQISNVHNTYNPHNQYASIALAIGLPGLLLFTLCLILPMIMAFQARDYFLFGFTLLFASLCLTEGVLERQKGVAFFALFFPLLAFHLQSFHTPASPPLKFFSARS
jgi:hypothetical protein